MTSKPRYSSSLPCARRFTAAVPIFIKENQDSRNFFDPKALGETPRFSGARCFFVFLVGSVLLSFTALAEEDFQYWTQFSVKPIDTKYVDYVNYWDLRFTDNASDLGVWFTSQKLIFDPLKHLSLGANYTYLENEAADSKTKNIEFKRHHRFELEVNPYWEMTKWVKVKNRNRVEFRWIEDQGSDNTRFRQRWELEVPVEKIPHVKSVYANNEIFFLFRQEKLVENRVVPFGINFKIFGHSTFSIFYMIQTKKVSGGRANNHIFGTHLYLSV